jgi:hypothetical protein
VLEWEGAAGSPVIWAYGNDGLTFQDFDIHTEGAAANTASEAIVLVGDNDANLGSSGLQFERMAIGGITAGVNTETGIRMTCAEEDACATSTQATAFCTGIGTPLACCTGLGTGPTCTNGDQVDMVAIRNVKFRNVGVCIDQDTGQAKSNVANNVLCQYDTDGLKIQKGSFSFLDGALMDQGASASSRAVVIGDHVGGSAWGADQVIIGGTHIETGAHVFVSDKAGYGFWGDILRFKDNRIRFTATGKNLLDIVTSSIVQVDGNYIHSSADMTENVTVVQGPRNPPDVYSGLGRLIWNANQLRQDATSTILDFSGTDVPITKNDTRRHPGCH